MYIKKTNGIKLNVKPVFIAFYHEYVFEGPCRFGMEEELTKEYDMKGSAAAYKKFQEELEQYMPEGVNVLAPVYVERNEELRIQEDLLEKIGEGSDEADVYLFGEKGRGYDIIVEFAQRYGKPIMFTENPLYNSITGAALLARGLEAYPTMTWEDTVETLKVLRVRKVLKETRVLLAPRENSNISFSTTDSFLSLEDVTAKLGIRFRYINAHELLDQLHDSDPENNYTLPRKKGLNPTSEDLKEIGKITDDFIAGAVECDMKRDDVFKSVNAFHTVKRLMADNQCSAFSMPCPDVCATRRLNQEEITFCLTHSLLNEEGIPSSCEYDIPALLSLIVLMNFSDSAPYMGNTVPMMIKDGKRQLGTSHLFRSRESLEVDIPNLGDTANVILTFHAVPNRKMKGFDKVPGPYAIRPFARAGKWGATIRYDFNKDKGQVITMCRFDPSCRKLFLAKGTIVGGIGYHDENCSEGVFFTVKDDKDFYNKQVAFGNHVPLVYGDYFSQVKRLGEILGLEVVTS